jgi:hypothetical protein
MIISNRKNTNFREIPIRLYNSKQKKKNLLEMASLLPVQKWEMKARKGFPMWFQFGDRFSARNEPRVVSN